MKIPKTLSDITFWQMEQMLEIKEEDETRRRLQEIAILCNIKYEDLYSKTDPAEVNKIIEGVNWFYGYDSELEPKFEFEFKGNKYTLMKDFERSIYIQWLDMSVQSQKYRDNIWTQRRYELSIYSMKDNQTDYFKYSDELEERAELFKDLTMDIVYPYIKYYELKKKRLLILGHQYLESSSQNQNTPITIKDTMKNGEYMEAFMICVGVILLNLIILVGYLYMKYSSFKAWLMKGIRFKDKLNWLMNRKISIDK